MPLNLFELYEDAVIDSKADIRLFQNIFRELCRREPRRYREDFCGTFLHSIEWVKSHSKNEAWALDLSTEPLKYGIDRHLSKLKADQKLRLHPLKQNVISPFRGKVDLITAMNFSYFCLKDRETMKAYFKRAFSTLDHRGLFLMDMIGGSQMHMANTEKRRIESSKKHELKGKSFYYIWEQENYDPISNEAKFAMHFEIPSLKKKLKNVFTYDWRLWSIPELRELLAEVGFKRSVVYWEGTSRDGSGNGLFTQKTHEENCEVWIAYIAAVRE